MSTPGVDMEARRTSASRVIAAPASEIFDVLADPSRHVEIDGSGTVQSLRGRSKRLELGSKFGMAMKLSVLPYPIANTVVEFEEDRLIAWQHLGKHRWRFELAEVEGGTEVTETFDWSTSASPAVIEKAGYPQRHLANIERTLENLAKVCER